ncbi:MAG: hypothetical protein ACJ8C4_05720 [Gemmataceae bacterium]
MSSTTEISVNSIQQDLQQLSRLRNELDNLKADTESAKKLILRPVRQQLTRLEKNHNTRASGLEDGIAELEAKIKAETIAVGETVKGEELMAVYYKPRVSWDTSKLEGMAVAVPQILDAKAEGKPSAQIRESAGSGG